MNYWTTQTTEKIESHINALAARFFFADHLGGGAWSQLDQMAAALADHARSGEEMPDRFYARRVMVKAHKLMAARS